MTYMPAHRTLFPMPTRTPRCMHDNFPTYLDPSPNRYGALSGRMPAQSRKDAAKPGRAPDHEIHFGSIRDLNNSRRRRARVCQKSRGVR
eukprot:6201725-Pleurochrysis_carterae.AAC.1